MEKKERNPLSNHGMQQKAGNFKAKCLNRFTMLREREDYYHENNKDTMKNMFFIGNKNIFELDNYDKEEVERQRKVGAAAFNKKNGSNRKDKKAKTKKKII